MKSYADALLRYFSFSGRSSRSQYWIFQLVMLLLLIVAVEIDLVRGDPIHRGRFGFEYGLVTSCVIFFHIVPATTIAVRRLHDVGRSGWWYLMIFIPFAVFWLLYQHCLSSEPGTNAYGEDPSNMPPPQPEYVPATGIARVPNLSRPAPVSAVRAVSGAQPRTFGLRGR